MGKEKCNILSVVGEKTSAQFRYRVRNVSEALMGLKIGMKWVLQSELEEVDLSEVDLVVILRQTDKNGAIGRFVDFAHRAGIDVLFDLDDLIFDYRDVPVLMRTTNSKNVVYWLGYFWGIRRIARKVDGFICTNGFLAGKLKRSFGKPVKVIRNSLNREQVEISEKLVKKKVSKKGEFVIGYFSGSPTHKKDFELAEKGVLDLMKLHSDAKLRVVGYMKLSDEMQKMIEGGRVELMEVVDYLKLQELIAKVDVNMAPLVVNDFTNCKSELKFFEAGVVETTTVASPAYAFRNAVSDGENGLLAEPDEWFDKLNYLYQNPEENRKIAVRAKKDVLKYYYGKEFLKEVEEAYEYFL